MAWFTSSKSTAEEASAYTADASQAPVDPAVEPASAPEVPEAPEPAPRVTEPNFTGVDPRPFIAWLVEAETEGNRDVYPMPQELQPTVTDSATPLDQPVEDLAQVVTDSAEAHLGDPDSGGELPE